MNDEFKRDKVLRCAQDDRKLKRKLQCLLVVHGQFGLISSRGLRLAV